MPGLCIGLGKTPGTVHAPAPRLGEHTETAGRWPARGFPTPHPSPAAVERGATLSAAPPSPSQWGGAGGGAAGRGPLAGVRALDLGTILAGPYAGTLLAGLGADVVKVESPAGDAFRETGFVYNRGMRGLAIDLSKPGRPAGVPPRRRDGRRRHRQLAARRPEAAARRLRHAGGGQPAHHHPVGRRLRRARPVRAQAGLRPGPPGDERHDDRPGRRQRPRLLHHPRQRRRRGRHRRPGGLPRPSTIAARAARVSAPGPRWWPPR